MSDAAIDLQDEPFPTSVGERIAHARKLAGLTQKALAEAIEKSRPTIVQYEADKISPPLSMIQELARVLQTTPEYLAFGIDLARESEINMLEVSIGALAPDGEFTSTESAMLPAHLIIEKFGTVGAPQIIQLDQEARSFGLSKGDLVLVDRSAKLTPGDGKYYAVASSAGLSVILNAVQLVQKPGEFEVQDGSGQRHQLAQPPNTLGRVCGALITL